MNSSGGVIPEFRMSSFVALIGLRRYIADHPGTPPAVAAVSLQRSDSDYSATDFGRALHLHELIPAEVDFTDTSQGLRLGLSILIRKHRPWWCRLFPHGRQRLATALTQDELQTFRSAGLYDTLPTFEVVEWWDSLAALMRSWEEERLVEQGRHAERLSLEYEMKRLSSIGLDSVPRWVALEDNSAGYDIQSYDRTPFGLKNILIEVKSSQRESPRLILTRNEWNAAQRYGEAYIFHLWSLPSEQLTVKSVSQIADHIPMDQGEGCWTEVEIPF